MKAYTSVVGSKSTDIIYARGLVYKVLKRSPRGACGIIDILHILKYHDEVFWRETVAMHCLMFS